MVDWESIKGADFMTQTSKCVFCAELARITLIRTADGKEVPACRECVPRGKRLSWAENPAFESVEHILGACDIKPSPATQMFKVTQ